MDIKDSEDSSMIAPVWPSSLPIRPLENVCRGNRAARFDLNTFEVATLIKFIDGDLHDGNEPFIFENPTTGDAVSCKFMDQPSIAPKPDDQPGWIVSCDLEVSAGQKPLASENEEKSKEKIGENHRKC